MKRNAILIPNLIIMLLFSTILVACGSNSSHKGHETHSTSQHQSNSTLQIKFSTKPSSFKQNSSSQLIADIKQSGKTVKDAQVEFEFWSNDSKKQKIKATLNSDGLYTSKHTFSKSGNYDVIVHVVTPQTHQMIADTFQVK